jgi:hypothetical protein
VSDEDLRKDEDLARSVARYEDAYHQALIDEAAATGRPVPPHRRRELAQEAARGWLAKAVLDNKLKVNVRWGRDRKISDIPEARRQEAITALRAGDAENPPIPRPTAAQVVEWLNKNGL